jgi:hypothetical protein
MKEAYVCVLILYKRVLILLYICHVCPHTIYTYPYTPIYMSSYSIVVLHATDSGGLLEDLQRLPVLENLVREPAS